MMILIIASNAWQLFQNRDTAALQDLDITDAGALEDAGRGICASGDYYHLAGVHSSQHSVRGCQIFRIGKIFGIRLVLDPDRALVAIEQNLYHLLFNQHM